MPRIFSFLLGSSGGGGSGDFFKTFVPVTGSNVIATVTDDTFTFASDGNIRITGDSFTKTMTLALGATTFVPRSVLYAGQSGIISQSPFDFNFDYTNKGLALGTTVSSIFAYGSTSIPWLKVVSEDSDGDKPHALFQTFSDGIVNPAISFVYSRGTESSPAATQAGDVIGAVDFFANDGSGYNYSSTITSIAKSPIASGSIPSWLYFATTSSGGSLPVAAMVLTENQSAYFYGNVYTTLLANQTIPYVDINSKLTASADLTWNNTLSRLTTGDIKVTNLNPSQLVSTTSQSILQSEAFSANGQLIIGKNTGGFSKATLTAGSNVTITNGSGSITIATSSSPSFTSVTTGSLTVTGLTINRVPYVTTGGLFAVSSNLRFDPTTSQLNLASGYLTIGFVNWKVGDNFTMVSDGNIGIIRPATATIGINFYRGTSIASTNYRWKIFVDNTTESGSNAGSNFRFNAYSDSGAIIDAPIIITRAAGGNIALIRNVGVTGSLTTSSTILCGSNLYIDSETGTSQKMLRMNRYTGTEAQTSGYANKISLYADSGLNPIIGFGVNGTSLDYVSNNSHTFYTNAVKCFVFATGVSDPVATFYAQSTIDFTLSTGNGLYSKIVSTATSGTAVAIRGEIRPTYSGAAATRFTCVEGTPIYTGIAGDNTAYVTGFHVETSLPPNTYTLSETYGYWCRLRRNVTGGTVTNAIGYLVDQSTNTAGTITTAYGVKINALTLATTNWQLAVESGNSYFAGSTRFGSTTAPTSTVDITGTIAVSSTSSFTGAATFSSTIAATATRSATGNAFSFTDANSATSGSLTNIRAATKPSNSSASTALSVSIVTSPTMSSIGANITGSGVWGLYNGTEVPPNTFTVDVVGGATIVLNRTVSGGTVTTMYGGYIVQGTASNGTVTTAYGLRIGALTLGGTNWQLAVESGNSYFAGSVTVGATSAPGTTLDVQGTLNATGNVTLTSKVTKYNNVSTVAAGVASIVATSDLTTQSAAITATTIYAVPASGAGMYRVSWMATITRAATTSCTLGGTNGFQVKFTDNNDSVVKTSNPAAVSFMTSSTNATGTAVYGTAMAYCKASTNLQYLFDYTSSGATSMQYDLSIRVEYLG